MSTIDFFYDCSSPWTYLAFEQIQPIAQRHGATIVWKPFLVGAVFNAINPSVYQSRTAPIPSKAAYHVKDMQDWADLAGLKILFPPTVFPVNSAKAMRGALVAERHGVQVPYARAVFKAYWSDDQDIAKPEVLAALAQAVGLDPGSFLADIETPAMKEALRANTDEVMARGGFGSPTYFLNGTDMFFGNDRLGLMEAKLNQQR